MLDRVVNSEPLRLSVRGWGVLIAFILVSTLGVPDRASGQSGEWRAYAADLASSKYSPLDQINADNVERLQIVWRQSTIRRRSSGKGTRCDHPRRSRIPPLMIGGLLYVSTALGTVAALDATTGEVVWYDPAPVEDGQAVRRGAAARGVAYWDDAESDDERIFAVIESKLVALNAKTGDRYLSFGEGGEVDVTLGYDDLEVATFRWRSPPLVVRDIVVIGSSINDITSDSRPALKTMPKRERSRLRRQHR